jgi:cephalosporin-C deacetylase-like acetyl esterase
MLTDLDEAGLLDYRSAVVDPEDFDSFWADQLQRAAEHPIDVRVTAVNSLLETVDVLDIQFAGYDGHPIRGWLRDDVAAVVAHVPFLCDIRRASRITDAMPDKEIGRYLATHRDAPEQVFATLAYFDGVSLARRITAPAWLSAALMDPTCRPSTVYGVYHELAGEREIQLWEFNGHEGGGPDDDEHAVRALKAVFDRTEG